MNTYNNELKQIRIRKAIFLPWETTLYSHK